MSKTPQERKAMEKDASEQPTANGFHHLGSKQLCTNSLYKFLQDYYSIIDEFFFTVRLVSQLDTMHAAALDALIDTAKSSDERKELEEKRESLGQAQERLEKFGSINSRNITNGFTDLFLWYISAIIQECAKRRPEIIKSSEKISVAEVLEFTNRRELENYLIDRKINSLSYGGIAAVEKFFEETLGIALFSNPEEKEKVKILNEIRNINAHNRGYVNRLFLERTEGQTFRVFPANKRAHLDFDDLSDLTAACLSVAMRIDTEASEKFKIKRKRFSTWRKKQ
jgi:hypothetical protein